MTDHDRQTLLEKYFTTEEIVCMDYIATKAAREVFAEHITACPREPRVKELMEWRAEVEAKKAKWTDNWIQTALTTIALFVSSYAVWKATSGQAGQP